MAEVKTCEACNGRGFIITNKTSGGMAAVASWRLIDVCHECGHFEDSRFRSTKEVADYLYRLVDCASAGAEEYQSLARALNIPVRLPKEK